MERKIRILIVEDEALIAQWLKMELELFDYEVISLVGSGEEAIVEARENEPDIILMDIYLSEDIDGVMAAEKILEFKEIPIIFMTGYSNTETQKRIKEIKPSYNLFKPISIHEVKSKIDSIFESRLLK